MFEKVLYMIVLFACIVTGIMLWIYVKNKRKSDKAESNEQKTAEKKNVSQQEDDSDKLVLKGSDGNFYQLFEKPFNKGGEGAIYLICGHNDVVAKVFRKELNLDILHQKLQWMIKIDNKDISAYTTWPEVLLYDQGIFVGYVMKKLSGGVTMPVFQGPDFENVRWDMKVLAALNLAIVVHNIHAAGLVCGDLRGRNIYVNTTQYTVTIMDVDSFHIREESKGIFYPCRVADPEYLAPELLKPFLKGENFDNMKEPTFTQATDRFALAIHIFMLLMDGYHPFAARLLPGNENIEYLPKKYENIWMGKSYFIDPHPYYAPPLGAPSMKILPDELRKMFYWTFIKGYDNPDFRSTADEWKGALYKMKGRFARCDFGHYYYDKLSQCPWCSSQEMKEKQRKN